MYYSNRLLKAFYMPKGFGDISRSVCVYQIQYHLYIYIYIQTGYSRPFTCPRVLATSRASSSRLKPYSLIKTLHSNQNPTL